MKFQPGESGNKNGRPLGSKNKRTQHAQLLESYAEKLIGKVIELALNGDVNALRLCMERLIPKAAHEPVTLNFDMSQINKHEYLMNFGREILSAVADGEITPSDAKTLSSMADTHRRLIENGEMKRMLEEIERARKMGR
jgi:hypothetical protein